MSTPQEQAARVWLLIGQLFLGGAVAFAVAWLMGQVF